MNYLIICMVEQWSMILSCAFVYFFHQDPSFVCWVLSGQHDGILQCCNVICISSTNNNSIAVLVSSVICLSKENNNQEMLLLRNQSSCFQLAQSTCLHSVNSLFYTHAISFIRIAIECKYNDDFKQWVKPSNICYSHNQCIILIGYNTQSIKS